MTDPNCYACAGSGWLDHPNLPGETPCRCVAESERRREENEHRRERARAAIKEAEGVDLTAIEDGHTGDVW